MNKLTKIIVVNGKDYKLNIFVERRNYARASFTNGGINIRLPKHLSVKEQNKIGKEMLDWAVEKISNNPEKYDDKHYSDGDNIFALGIEYTIKIEYALSQKNSMKVLNNLVTFKISENHNQDKQQKYIKRNIQKFISENHIEEFKKHVHRINENHFKKNIGEIKLKNFSSKWGQCFTRSGNLDFSIRLLLAPMPVIEYVIIHEIAHLYEANHSRKFWNIVSQIDSGYKEKVKWLKNHGHKLII